MRDVDLSHSQHPPRLRRDLTTIVVDEDARGWRMVVDEISGRFSRVSQQVWESLQSGQASGATWNEARSVGWTRERCAAPKRAFSLLAIRIPLGTVDRFARWLAPRTSWLFGPAAIAIWCGVMLVALALSIARYAEWTHAIAQLPRYLSQLHPLHLVFWFVFTKLIHELGHAIVCRRIGARSGEVGIMLFCGIPCPYCDVTDSWRVPSRLARCGVMIAGIYVELVLASLAFFVWNFSSDPTWQFSSVYVMLVCGVSTLVFNANPLMRYDGYHVLAECVSSVNLRSEARGAWTSLVLRMVGGSAEGRTFRLGTRRYLLAAYHIASSIYRVFVAIAIATLLVTMAGYVYLRPVAVVFVLLVLAMGCVRFVASFVNVIRGHGDWASVGWTRRTSVTLGVMAILVAVLFVPTPRYRRVGGMIEPSDAVTVYTTNSGTVESVDAEFGDAVRAGTVLVAINDDDTALESLRLQGQLRLASLRRSSSQRTALDRPDAAKQWEILQASETALATSVREVESRLQASRLAAPIDGTLLPPPQSRDPKGATLSRMPSESGSRMPLRRRAGMVVERDQAWCRISRSGERHALLKMDAKDRERVAVGDGVMIREACDPTNVHPSKIIALSPMVKDESSITTANYFLATCSLAQVDPLTLVRSIDGACDAVVRLPRRSLASDLIDALMVWLRD